jgi:pyruvate/2-oxoglutarate dehydrogenase complex dihydrolipoamide acyltransferase (E2) component
VDVEFPRLADTLVEGIVKSWLKNVGDPVRKGEPLFEVETDKVNTEVESPYDGVLAEILVAEGELAQVGQLLARLTSDAEVPVGVHTALTGPARSAPPAPAPAASMRVRIAERMLEARATIAQGSCVREIDLRGIERGERSWTAYFVAAFARAANESAVGVAVDVPDGLVVPVVRDANTASVDDISASIRDLAARARSGSLRAEDMGGAGASVTNVGGGGTLMAFPLVAPGQRAILAPGAVRDGHAFVTLGYDRTHYDDFAADRLLARIAGELAALGSSPVRR